MSTIGDFSNKGLPAPLNPANINDKEPKKKDEPTASPSSVSAVARDALIKEADIQSQSVSSKPAISSSKPSKSGKLETIPQSTKGLSQNEMDELRLAVEEGEFGKILRKTDKMNSAQLREIISLAEDMMARCEILDEDRNKELNFLTDEKPEKTIKKDFNPEDTINIKRPIPRRPNQNQTKIKPSNQKPADGAVFRPIDPEIEMWKDFIDRLQEKRNYNFQNNFDDSRYQECIDEINAGFKPTFIGKKNKNSSYESICDENLKRMLGYRKKLEGYMESLSPEKQAKSSSLGYFKENEKLIAEVSELKNLLINSS